MGCQCGVSEEQRGLPRGLLDFWLENLGEVGWIIKMGGMAEGNPLMGSK